MILSVIEMILPIAIAFSIGILMRKKNMMKQRLRVENPLL
jgi:hypothetical protein